MAGEPISRQEDRAGDAQTVLAELRDQIAAIHQQRQSTGLTTWALMAAIGTAAWLLLDQCEGPLWGPENRTNFSPLSLVVLGLWIAVDGAAFAIRTLKPPRSSSTPDIRLQLASSAFASSRIQMVWWTFRFGAVAGLVIWLWPSVPSYVALPLTTLYGAAFLLGLLAVTFAFVDIPVRLNEPVATPWIAILVAEFLAVMLATAGIVILRPAFTPDVPLNYLRVAGLIVLLIYLVGALANQTPSTPLLSTLEEIRRDLSFGRIGVEAARRQAEAVTIGLRAEWMIQDDVQRLLAMYAEIERQRESLSKKVQAVRQSLSEGGPWTETRTELVKTMFSGLHADFDRLNLALTETGEEFVRFGAKAGRVTRFDDQIWKTSDGLRQLKVAVEGVGPSCTAIGEEIIALGSDIKAMANPRDNTGS